jgi:glutathione S-transferase
MQLLANTTSPYMRIARIAMIEKGLDTEPTIVDPWADDARLREANAATRVPTLITNDGIPLTESLLIVMWLERKYPKGASLLGNDGKGDDAEGILSRAGIAMGVIDAATITIITRKVTAPAALFDDTPVGLRRRRTMAEGIARLEAQAGALGRNASPTLDDVAAVVAIDYLRFRFPDVPWLPPLPRLDALSATLRARPSFAASMPR